MGNEKRAYVLLCWWDGDYPPNLQPPEEAMGPGKYDPDYRAIQLRWYDTGEKMAAWQRLPEDAAERAGMPVRRKTFVVPADRREKLEDDIVALFDGVMAEMESHNA